MPQNPTTPCPPHRRGRALTRALHPSQSASPITSLAASVASPGVSILLNTPARRPRPALGVFVLCTANKLRRDKQNENYHWPKHHEGFSTFGLKEEHRTCTMGMLGRQ